MPPIQTFTETPTLLIQQRRELAEFFGFETRNKYAITDESGQNLGFAAEQQKGILGFLFRQALGHWRPFEIHFFNSERELVIRARHPFRFFFQRLEVTSAEGAPLGALQQRFSFFSKKFDVLGPGGEILLRVSSPIWRIWTFAFERDGRKVAVIEKKWSGLLREAFTDGDRFRVLIQDPELSPGERLLLLAASIFVDLQYFERKAG